MIRSADTVEAEMLAPLAGRGDVMLEQVLAWSAINTGSRNLVGLEAMAGRLMEAFSSLDGDLRLVEPDAVDAIDAAGKHHALRHGRNLHFSTRQDAALRVLLVGHMDTVYPVDHPFQQTQWREPGVLNGPGVADMKGGISVLLSALTAFEASPLAARLGIEVIINSDEEVSSLGSAALLREAAGRCQIGLAFEPSFLPDGTLAAARKGSGNFSVAIRGRASHAGRNPEDGRNAIVAAADLTLRLAALNGKKPGFTVNPARIDGGGANNVVPDLAVLRFNMRVATLFDQEWAEAEIAAALEAVAKAHDVQVDLNGGFARPPKPMDNHQEALFNLARSCGRDLGLDIRWKDSGGVCDGNNLAAQGLAVVDTLGVRGGAIHSADEYMFVDSLVERAQLSALILARLAQGHWSS